MVIWMLTIWYLCILNYFIYVVHQCIISLCRPVRINLCNVHIYMWQYTCTHVHMGVFVSIIHSDDYTFLSLADDDGLSKDGYRGQRMGSTEDHALQPSPRICETVGDWNSREYRLEPSSTCRVLWHFERSGAARISTLVFLYEHVQFDKAWERLQKLLLWDDLHQHEFRRQSSIGI